MTQIPVQHLRCNAAQMRSRASIPELAQLAVQVQAGLDPSLHLIGKAREDGLVDVISGHRRWLASMVAHLALKAPLSAEIRLGLASAFIEERLPVVMGNKELIHLFPETYYELAEECESLSLPVEMWEGPAQDEIALLITANVGAEEPDLVGMGKTFIRALEADMSFEDLARVTGKPAAMVEAIAEVPMLPDVLQDLVRDGRLSLTVVPDLVRLDSRQIQGLALALKGLLRDGQLETHDLTNKVRRAISNMAYSPPEPSPRAETFAGKYNEAHILRHLWGIALGGSKPELVYEQLARRALLGYAPIRDGQSLQDFLQGIKALGKYIAPYRGGGSTKFSPEALEFLPEDVSCATCAYAQLPDHRLERDFPVPCRTGGKPEAGRCIYGVPATEKFAIAIPWLWHENAGKAVHTGKALLEAFEEQRAYEASITHVAAQPEASIETQREDIAFYMERHVQAPFSDHPWAANCATCKFHLEESPLKADPDAPHCKWAKGRRNLHFEAYIPSDPDSARPVVAACRQYGPAGSWAEIVPDSAPGIMSREAMVDVLVVLAREYGRQTWGPECRGFLRFLTGRPESAKADYRSSFTDELRRVKAELSDGQLWTLVQWGLMDYARKMDGQKTYLPSGEGAHYDLLPIRVALSGRGVKS